MNTKLPIKKGSPMTCWKGTKEQFMHLLVEAILKFNVRVQSEMFSYAVDSNAVC